MESRFAKGLGVVVSAFLISSVGLVLFYRFVPVRYTSLMLIRQAEAREEGREPRTCKRWVSIEDISPNLITAVVNQEDARFFQHKGFDVDAILEAYEYNYTVGRIARGGSTISQQTAKNAFCTPSRTYLRKAFEAYFTVLIEFLWGKDRIMEVYLNIIEWGDGIYGVEAASEYYFGHSAVMLDDAEAHFLARLIPHPRVNYR